MKVQRLRTAFLQRDKRQKKRPRLQISKQNCYLDTQLTVKLATKTTETSAIEPTYIKLLGSLRL